MSIIRGYVVPHPPLIIPEIGEGLEKDIRITVNAYEKIAKEIAKIKPETIIISSPHATMYGDYFHISPGDKAVGNFARFKTADIKIAVEYDVQLREEIIKQLSSLDIPAGTHGEQDPELDHGTMIPLYFIKKYYSKFKVIRIGLSGLSLFEHYKLGKIIRNVLSRKQNVVWIASGDLSHKLKEDGPYGYSEAGPKFDRLVTEALAIGNFYHLLKIEDSLRKNAAECGLASFCMMAGAFDGYLVNSNLLSYEGPFGVGYATASFEPLHYSDDREFARRYKNRKDRLFREKRKAEDEYVSLARNALEFYVRNHQTLTVPEDTKSKLLNKTGGVFVSLHIDNQLRGCIGTIDSTTDSIADEIIQNAISAGTRDYRFQKVRDNELDRIEYSVDVLKTPELINNVEDLDVSKYGLIVKSGDKSGLLLPNIDGIETVEYQIKIAKRKAGISDNEQFTMERFKVIRHH